MKTNCWWCWREYRTQFHSGKKKRHTLKAQVVVNQLNGQVICIAFGKGRVHDFRLFKLHRLPMLPEQLLAQVQLCIVHMVRNSLRYVSYKHRQAVATDLKLIYTASTEVEAEQQLMAFAECRGQAVPHN